MIRPVNSAKTWYKMHSVNVDSAEVMIYDEIGMYGITASKFAEDLTNLGPIKNLTVRINSYGGEVFDGFAIFNRLKECKAQVIVIIDGVAASIASVIAMAGSVVKIPKNAFIMIHDPSVFVGGNARDLRGAADLLDNLKDSAIASYQSKTSKLSKEKIWDMMAEETWINSEDAVKFGFADEIIDDTENEEPVTNRGLKLPENLKQVFLSINKPLPSGLQNPITKGQTMNTCPHCGKEHAKDAVYCNHCGKATAQTAPDFKMAVEKERNEAQMLERQRVTNITTVCSAAGLPQDFISGLIQSGKSIDECSIEIANKIKENKPQDSVPPAAGVIKDAADKFRAHAINCLIVATGIEKDPKVKQEVRKDEQIDGLHSLMQRVLKNNGVDPIGLNPHALVRESLKMAGTSSSDLPYILESVVNKSLLAGYNEAPVTWPLWCNTIEVKDFRPNSLVKMSNFGDIDDLPEGMPFRNGKLSDNKELVSVDTKGKMFTITRNALVNDDLNAISRVPYAMTAAVARRQNRDVYDILTASTNAGPTMTDGNALFDSTNHSNVKASSGVPSVSSIATAQRLLMEMPLPKAEADSVIQFANIQGKYLLAGTANMITIDQLLNTPFDSAKGIAGVYNPYAQGRIVPIYDAYLQYKLTANSKANAFYVVADPNALETFVMAFLQGNRTPTLQGEASGIGEALGFSWHIYHDWGIGVADYRGIIYNDGV